MAHLSIFGVLLNSYPQLEAVRENELPRYF